MKDNNTEGLRISVFLAEYQSLRSEIQSRSDFQNRIVQMHLTALGLLIGLVLTKSTGFVIVLLIPIESAILGRWWLDSAINIGQIGLYLAESIETDVNKLLGWDCLKWESGIRSRNSDVVGRLVASAHIGPLIDATFEMPAYASWLVFLLYAFSRFGEVGEARQHGVLIFGVLILILAGVVTFRGFRKEKNLHGTLGRMRSQFWYPGKN